MLDGKNLFYNELGVFILKFKNYFFASYLKYYFWIIDKVYIMSTWLLRK